MIKKIGSYLKRKSGMSLVETLTALTLISLVIFCFAPLMLSYFNTIDIAGDKLQSTYAEAGLLQKLIGNRGTGANTGYESNVSAIPLAFTTPETTVTRDGVSQQVAPLTIAVGSTSGISGFIDPIQANFITSNPENVKKGFTTIYTNEINSSIKCFPSTITDDFKTAYVTIVADGFSFADDSLKSDKYAFYVTKTVNGNATLFRLTYGKDYMLEKMKNSNDQILILTLYGGSNISFENSPLVFNYNNGAYIKNIEIDAPMMIMVGEAATDSEYYYYVSRGNIDENGKLEIIRRTMDSVDQYGNSITLTSAMNDVEWVPAESADSYAVDKDGEKYGYYVMCGDNGQVRRFWKNNTTGNYYWGGDYTYYTDYNFNHFGSGTYINSTDASGNAYNGRVYSTDVSFKFISQRDMTNNQSGFNMASKEYTLIGGLVNTSTALVRGLSVVSVTYSDDAEFYGPDGELFYYQMKNDGSSVYPTYTQTKSFGSSWQGVKTQLDLTMPTNTAYAWLQTTTNSYYDFNNARASMNRASYPITLTSVDSILITGSGSAHRSNVTADSEGSYYFTSTGDGDTTAEGATTNLNYPQETYTLYCGYIPAMMDLWAEVTGNGTYRYPTGFKEVYAKTSDGTWYDVSSASQLNRAANELTVDRAQSYYTKWRMTMGVTPYYTSGNSTVVSETGTLAYYKKNGWTWSYPREYLIYYPYTNVQYAITGKFYDVETFNENRAEINDMFSTTYSLASPALLINNYDNTQQNITNNEIVDVTIAYLSHPYAIAIAANPTDDIIYDYGNVKGDEDNYGQVFYWNNRRETITFLDSASTVIPNGDNDIPVSLMVGYLLGGTVEFSKSGSDIYANVGSVMNNGIVFLRAGNYNVEKQNATNGQTYEYLATDNDGYKLNSESNVFHQFYYLNSRSTSSSNPSKGNHIGDLYGADYWQTNRHIQYKSIYGDPAADELAEDGSNKYEYLRSHPMTNTQVTCVAWGTTWSGNPEAMWGTENGTVLSWWVDLNSVSSDSSEKWNDRSVDAEIQSYKWIDNCDGVTFATDSSEYKGTIGSALAGSGSNEGAAFSPGSDRFKYFYDKGTQATSSYGTIGFINTLESINDIEFANDLWIAVGNQSDVDPADYCAPGAMTFGNYSAGTQKLVQAYTGNGRGGSWVNVRYWVDIAGTGVHSDDNSTYHWKAVKISNNKNYNIVQINYVNGLWIATGYVDANNDDNFDEGEKTVVCWAKDPLLSCDSAGEGGWSEETAVWELQNGAFVDVTKQMSGINSVATRS